MSEADLIERWRKVVRPDEMWAVIDRTPPEPERDRKLREFAVACAAIVRQRCREYENAFYAAADAVARLAEHMTQADANRFAALRRAIGDLYRSGYLVWDLTWALTEPDAMTAARAAARTAVDAVVHAREFELDRLVRRVFDWSLEAVHEVGEPPSCESGFRELPADEQDERRDEREEELDRKLGTGEDELSVEEVVWSVARKVIGGGAWTERGFSFDQFHAQATEAANRFLRAELERVQADTLRLIFGEPR